MRTRKDSRALSPSTAMLFRAGRARVVVMLIMAGTGAAAMLLCDGNYDITKHLRIEDGTGATCFCDGAGTAGMQPPGRELRILWYNVENLFHPSDDSLPGDDEFTPAGVRHWTWERYRKKLTALAKVIVAAGEGEPPELVGLAEVENDSVLADLAGHPILRPYGYACLHRDGPDHRGMDVAVLCREERFGLLECTFHPPPPDDLLSDTREMVHICGTWGRRDTLDLFLVHLISRYGGTGATAAYRREQVRLLSRLIDSVLSHRQQALVLVAGDFNEEADGYAMEPLRQVLSGGDSVRTISPEGRAGNSFRIISPEIRAGNSIRNMGLEGGGGSYKYRGVWEQIDRFMVTGGTMRYRLEGSTLRLPVLLTPDEAYGGIKPRRTYEGFRYAGGVSDHLPVLLVIRRRLFPGGSAR